MRGLPHPPTHGSPHAPAMGRILHSVQSIPMYIRFYLVSLAQASPDHVYAFAYVSSQTRRPHMGHPCATNPELWFGYPDDDSGDGAARRAPTSGRPPRRGSNACAAARWLNSADAPSTPSHIARSTASGPASNFPAASIASANSLLEPTTSCGASPPARSTPGSYPRTRRCWHAANTRPSRCPRWCCTYRPHRLGHGRQPDRRRAA